MKKGEDTAMALHFPLKGTASDNKGSRKSPLTATLQRSKSEPFCETKFGHQAKSVLTKDPNCLAKHMFVSDAQVGVL